MQWWGKYIHLYSMQTTSSCPSVDCPVIELTIICSWKKVCIVSLHLYNIFLKYLLNVLLSPGYRVPGFDSGCSCSQTVRWAILPSSAAVQPSVLWQPVRRRHTGSVWTHSGPVLKHNTPQECAFTVQIGLNLLFINITITSTTTALNNNELFLCSTNISNVLSL